MPVLELGEKVINIANPAWGEGVIEALANRRGFFEVRWLDTNGRNLHLIDELKPAPGGDTESPNLGEEEIMERLYEIEQSVHDAGGNLGLITDFELRNNGVYYKVLWEDGRETLNVQSVLQPVVELKSTPTPKEVQEVTQLRKTVEENTYEAIKVVEAWDLTFGLGNTVCLIAEAVKKDHTEELADLEQAAYFLNRRIESLKARTQKDVA